MITYAVYKLIVYEIFIQIYLLNGDYVEKAIGVIGAIFYSIVGLFAIAIDILAIPLYVLFGILVLIFKIIEIRNRRR